jgi:peptide/nickel transport system permease protein
MAENAGPILIAAVEQKRRNILADVLLRLVKEKPMGTIGGVIVLLMLMTGIFANVLAPYGFKEPHLVFSLKPPGTPGFLLGTDNLGRDILSRVIYGARISMIVGIVATVISVLESTIIGMFSGFMGGKFDMVVQRFVDAWMCFPGLIIIMTIMSMVGTGMWQLIIVMGVSGGIGGSRVLRAAVIGIKGNIYVQAATSVGSPTVRTLMQHILPNIMAPIIIMFTIGMGGMILSEASLSFLGYGIPPPTPSWGGMLSGDGRSFMLQAPWLAFWPGLALSMAVFGINMLGDALRDILDPRLRGGVGRYSGVKTKKIKQRIQP